MYTENPAKDAVLFCKAFLSNQLARFAPKLYVNLTHQTGRGKKEGEALQVANYFIECFHDYRKCLNLNEEDFEYFLREKVVLEYGPGDILGMALLFYANGAESVHCVDRFPLSRLSKKNVEVYVHLLNLLDDEKRERAENAFKEKGNPESGFDEKAISYKVMRNGLSELNNKYDLIISRAVLEHVNDLKKTMLDIKCSMKVEGVSLHQVDLKSHGLDRYTDFDFLTWPKFIYDIMYSHKGFPNRFRVNAYREFAEKSGLKVKQLTPIGRLNQEKLDRIYLKVAKEFRPISPEELSWLGFWIYLEHA